ncbi:glycosyl hydrolase-related protein [Streptomyces sp. L7]
MKLADDGSGDVVVRFPRSTRGTGQGDADGRLPFDSVEVTDLLERPSSDAGEVTREGEQLALRLRPFELVTLRVPAGLSVWDRVPSVRRTSRAEGARPSRR